MTTPVLSVVLTLLLLVGLRPWLPVGSARRLSLPQASRVEGRSTRTSKAWLLGAGEAGVEGRSKGKARGVDVVVLLELLDVACRAGASVPRALDAVGDAIGGSDGSVLQEVGAALLLGAPWSSAWAGTGSGTTGAATRLRAVERALQSAWENGAAPSPALRAAGEALRREASRRTRTAAGRLGVRLVLPLGVCLLPAFILLGLVPILASLGAGLLTN